MTKYIVLFEEEKLERSSTVKRCLKFKHVPQFVKLDWFIDSMIKGELLDTESGNYTIDVSAL